MVPDGGGDWLQPGGELANPYFGSEMLRCGEKVSEFPAKGTSEPEGNEPNSGNQESHEGD
jgi:Cu(I)/Ag(I) efflux system membrane fusion protein